ASGLRRARRRVGRAGQGGVRMREKGPKMATEPRSGTDRPPRARVRNSRPGLLPGAPSEEAPEPRLFVPELGSVAIFGPKSCTATRGVTKTRRKSVTKGRGYCHAAGSEAG